MINTCSFCGEKKIIPLQLKEEGYSGPESKDSEIHIQNYGKDKNYNLKVCEDCILKCLINILGEPKPNGK
jgi:hypothetical protein